MEWRKNKAGEKAFVEYLKEVNKVGNGRYIKPKVPPIVVDNNKKTLCGCIRCEGLDYLNSTVNYIPSNIIK